VAQLITRWIVEEWIPEDNGDEGFWIPWCSSTHMYRFFSLKSAKRHYETHRQTFHYAPCKYRFVKTIIRPEEVIERIEMQPEKET
jgi:homospermidine synthase